MANVEALLADAGMMWVWMFRGTYYLYDAENLAMLGKVRNIKVGLGPTTGRDDAGGRSPGEPGTADRGRGGSVTTAGRHFRTQPVTTRLLTNHC
jgi:hypothetical protein